MFRSPSLKVKALAADARSKPRRTKDRSELQSEKTVASPEKGNNYPLKGHLGGKFSVYTPGLFLSLTSVA
jgi:hypothetical protein